MGEPSEYELDAWRELRQLKGRPLSRELRNASQRVAEGAAKVGERAASYVEKHPGASAAVSRGQRAAAKSGKVVGAGAKKAGDALPGWGQTAAGSLRKTVGRASRAGLSSKRVVAKHQKKGHDVARLSDLRRLDLEQIDVVRGRRLDWLYPAAAALSGAGSSFLISGGEFATVASGGAGAAPSAPVIAGAFAADTAAVLGLASRGVGQVSLLYGYDPETPVEKLFVMSVVNAGTALSASAKTSAMADISRLTQALVRGKTWAVLNESVVSRVATQFAKAFGVRLSKQGLGKLVPAVGIAIAGSLNWATLEGIIDTADMAYRRRFLLEKYPYLAEAEVPLSTEDLDVPDVSDHTISVLDEVEEAGGPDIK